MRLPGHMQEDSLHLGSTERRAGCALGREGGGVPGLPRSARGLAVPRVMASSSLTPSVEGSRGKASAGGREVELLVQEERQPQQRQVAHELDQAIGAAEEHQVRIGGRDLAKTHLRLRVDVLLEQLVLVVSPLSLAGRLLVRLFGERCKGEATGRRDEYRRRANRDTPTVSLRQKRRRYCRTDDPAHLPAFRDRARACV